MDWTVHLIKANYTKKLSLIVVTIAKGFVRFQVIYNF